MQSPVTTAPASIPHPRASSVPLGSLVQSPVTTAPVHPARWVTVFWVLLLGVLVLGFSGCKGSKANPNDGRSCAAMEEAFQGLTTYGSTQGGSYSPCENDRDEDAICDEDEVILGTSSAERDVFVEIDYMQSANISRQALRLVVNAFKKQDIQLHLDLGGKFSADDTFNSRYYNYCGGNELPDTALLALGNGDACSDPDECSTVSELKYENFASSRQQLFHYAVVGLVSAQDPEIAGTSQTPGKNFLVVTDLFEGNGETYSDNRVAATLMHELGHNLGLEHGGDVPENYKPNYESVMNYAYSIGLNATGTAEQWRYSRAWAGLCDSNYALSFDLKTEDIVLDYSSGENRSLDEQAVYESNGYGGGPVDFDCDGLTNGKLGAFDLNAQAEGANTGYTTLHDFDDWSNLVFDAESTALHAAAYGRPPVSTPCLEPSAAARRYGRGEGLPEPRPIEGWLLR